jgi:hypothetical protein
MSSNNTNTGGDPPDDNNNSYQELFVAIAALVISIVALIATLLQVAQQWFASAAGFANCDEKVMGLWHLSKKRVVRPYELRFEVQYEAPVIFLCPLSNKRGPVKDQPILFLTGTEESRKASWTTLQKDRKEDEEGQPQTEKERIHTADNEQASWVTLLGALQRMENESRQWQTDQYKHPQHPPKTDSPADWPCPEDLETAIKTVEGQYTLTAAVQKKPRSWDTMPTNVKKPYATTTMCHMVEMLAILGVYWVEFDRTHDRYRAEGNGYMVTGEKVSDLGIMFTFQVYGKSNFKENRVIPVDEIKELCFGYVPTIYRGISDNRRLGLPNEEPTDLRALQMASKADMAETLVSIGCNTTTVNQFLNPKSKDIHLFPSKYPP